MRVDQCSLNTPTRHPSQRVGHQRRAMPAVLVRRRNGQSLQISVPAVPAGDCVRDDLAIDPYGAGPVAWGRRADVADANAIDAPTGPECGNVDATGITVGAG